MRVAGMGRPSESRPFGTQIAYAHGVQFVVDRTGLQEVSGATVVVRFRIVDLSNEFGPYRVKVCDYVRAAAAATVGLPCVWQALTGASGVGSCGTATRCCGRSGTISRACIR